MTETRTCQNCKTSFLIEDDDFAFYQKISVPPPTWCPECRRIRRLVRRNERVLYKRVCSLCQRSIISIYSSDTSFPVYCAECYHSDKWNPLDYGKDYDFSKPFFEQFLELQSRTPRLYAFAFQNTNTEYANGVAFNKNSYLIFVSDYNEESLYSYRIMRCKDTVDCYNSTECELCYECIACEKCYRTAFSENCASCQNTLFSKNCVGCQDCIGCVNLRNKKFYIFNTPYSPGEHKKKVKEMRLDTSDGIAQLRNKMDIFAREHIVKYIRGTHNVNVTGDYISNSKSSFDSYGSSELENCKFIIWGDHIKDCHDAYVLIDNSQLSYENFGGIAHHNVAYTCLVWSGFDIRYSDMCENSNNLFGCISIRKGSYCIFNKQYSKDKYEALIPKIKEHMDRMPYTDKKNRKYKFGEFFPPELSPFAYNETIAQELHSLSEGDAEAEGYRWAIPKEKQHTPTVQANDLPVLITDVSDGILNEVIGCAHQGTCNEQCTSAFRIIKPELNFYRQINVPLPRVCPNCRHYQRLTQLNPLKLWHRQCMCDYTASKNSTSHAHHPKGRCPNEFETSYAPERKEVVYCEQCYQSEVV